MSIDKLTEAANRHLYAGELLYKLALALDEGVRGVSDSDALALLRIRQLLIDYAESELLITAGICDVAELESAKC